MPLSAQSNGLYSRKTGNFIKFKFTKSKGTFYVI